MKATQNTIPKNAYVGGRDVHNEPLNICRHSIFNITIAGKADKEKGCALTFNGKQEFVDKNQEFEVLMTNNVEWVARHGTDPVPEHAVVAGAKTNGQTFIGRCFVDNSEQIGKIDYQFYYGLNGLEHKECVNHEVLVCVQ